MRQVISIVVLSHAPKWSQIKNQLESFRCLQALQGTMRVSKRDRLENS